MRVRSSSERAVAFSSLGWLRGHIWMVDQALGASPCRIIRMPCLLPSARALRLCRRSTRHAAAAASAAAATPAGTYYGGRKVRETVKQYLSGDGSAAGAGGVRGGNPAARQFEVGARGSGLRGPGSDGGCRAEGVSELSIVLR